MILLCDQFTPKEYVLLYLKMEESKISRIRDIFKPFLFSVFVSESTVVGSTGGPAVQSSRKR